MDTLHTVLRAIQSDIRPTETKSAPDHLTVFREFLAHLNEIQRKAQVNAKSKSAVAKSVSTKTPRAKSARRKTKKTK